MRAVISVDGEPMVLASGQGCGACHGWRLTKMSNVNQSAEFENRIHQKVILKVQT